MSEPSPAPTSNAAVDPTNSAPGKGADSHAAKSVPAPVPPPPPVIVAAGTVLSVRLNDAVDTKNSEAGSQFTGSIAQAVTQEDATVIPAGSAVSGTVAQAESGGKIKGASSLSLHLTAVKIKGVSYAVSTDTFSQEGKGKGSRTAKLGVGGGAAGALIGGLAGGGKGAAIGAAAGAGAGVAGSAFTGNKELSIPAESALQFKLTQPLKIASGGAHNPNSDSNE